MKLLGKIVIIVFVVLVALVLMRNLVVKSVIQGGVGIATGMPVSIKKLDINFKKTLVDIEELVVKNPMGFEGTTFIDIPKILIDIDLGAILKGKIHLKNVELNLKQLSVVKNKKGELNLDKVKALTEAKKESKEAPKKAEPAKKAELPPFQIDRLHLKVGEASYIDYSSGQKSEKDFKINIDQTYEDITNLNKLIALIVMKVMMKTSISQLTGFDIGSLQDSLAGIKGSAMEMAGQALDTLETTGSVKDAADELTGSLKGAASSIKDKLKFGFGSKE